MTPIAGMKHYKCHKEVWAAKIESVDPASADLILDRQVQPYHVGQAWLAKHNPAAGDYLVQYKDGYLSVSPAAPFEEGYTLVGSDRFVFVVQHRAAFTSEPAAQDWIAKHEPEATASAMPLDPR